MKISAGGGKAIPVQCDHSKDEDIARVFEIINSDEGRLDILVNNAYSAVHTLIENFGKPFWEVPAESMWDEVNNVGLRYTVTRMPKLWWYLKKIVFPLRDSLIILFKKC